MANYEFKCTNCNHVYEYLDMKNRADEKRPCPECGTLNSKVMSAVNIKLGAGGVGWAKDGYSRQRSIADGPEPNSGNRHKRSGKTVVPVRNGGIALQGSKGEKASDKKPKIMVKK